MNGARLNVFQRLVRSWEACHPYNAAQALRIDGEPDLTNWTIAWRRCVVASGLGPVAVDGGYYRFESPNGCPLETGTVGDRAAFDAFLTREMNRPFERSELPLRPFLLRCSGDAGEPSFYVGIVYQHWIADSVSIRMLMERWLARVYLGGGDGARGFDLPAGGYWKSLGPQSGWSPAEAFMTIARRHTRLRQAQKVDSKHLKDHQTRFVTLDVPDGLGTGLRAAARGRGITVNDLLLAALAEACAAHVPLQRRPKRRDVAIASIVDLRRFCRRDLSGTFGLYLGFTSVICRPSVWKDFDQLTAVVRNQTGHQKSSALAGSNVMFLTVAALLGKLSQPDELYHFYRKELPLAGGLSNVRVAGEWPAVGGEKSFRILEYLRVSPTGPMTPIVLTATTRGEQMSLGMTHRTGLIPVERAGAFAEMLVRRLRVVACI